MPTIPFGINRKTKKEEHIKIASKLNKYVCAVCSQPLIIRDGDEKEKHFAHFRPEEECILRTKNKYLDGSGDGDSLRGGIKQDFDDWMEYVKAVERGDHEIAATLWDFNITSEGVETEQPHKLEDVEEESSILEENTSELLYDPPEIPTTTIYSSKHLPISEPPPQKEYKRVKPVEDDLEHVTRQAMIKLIRNKEVAYCPVDKKAASAHQCEDCKFCLDIRQPLINPDAPHAVLCQGHHKLDDDGSSSLLDLLFEYNNK